MSSPELLDAVPYWTEKMLLGSTPLAGLANEAWSLIFSGGRRTTRSSTARARRRLSPDRGIEAAAS